MTTTFQTAREAYLHQAALRSQHTQDAYMRAIDLFLDYLNDRRFAEHLLLQKHLKAAAGELPLSALTAEDEGVFYLFARWLQSATEDRPAYARSTIDLRMAGVQRWFEFMAKKGWLPVGFSVKRAVARVKSELVRQEAPSETTASQVHDLSAMVDYYAHQKPPKTIQKDARRLHRWNLTRLRNHALLQMLAETGGQISALLEINAADLSEARRPLKIAITGKSQHQYTITLDDALPAVRDYLKARGLSSNKKTPLFISHDAKFEGQRMSRVIAWRVIQRAARAVGLGKVSPHDFRHWRASQLIQDGHSLEEVQQLLGHRSIHTVRAYYGHMVDGD
jgi:site-specific recombinase XerD